MTMRGWMSGVMVAGVLAVSPMVVRAQGGTGSGTGSEAAGQAASQAAAPSVTADGSAVTARVSRELLTSTVHEAWIASGRNEDKFFDMVKQLAELSAQKRGVSLPNTEAAGQAMGAAIKANARRDPDQLLYAVVDTAVKQTAGTGSTPGR